MKYQGCDVRCNRGSYKKVLQLLPKSPLKCLNIGSGTILELEKYLVSQRNNIDIIDCVDRNAPLSENGGGGAIAETPYRNFYIRDVETVFKLQEEYDVVFCFEVIEHLDETDILLENCYNHLKDGGLFFLSHPNLSSIFARLSLLMGLQPYCLQISNKIGNFGTGFIGRICSPTTNISHHIRGITLKAMKEMLVYNNFKIERVYNETDSSRLVKMLPPGLGSTPLYVCRK